MNKYEGLQTLKQGSYTEKNPQAIGRDLLNSQYKRFGYANYF